ncbi:dTDP-4-dehydrorhamnose reductase [Escherichia coli]|uniref:dTDP-4-dehydrorhamnose reductase n=1 Tax=Escherichia coli TaxID=562 RepID=A0A377D5S8_ECOLX|nr:dTDP-4-dehydrorhamnose reductase [Escherichia coli]
MRAASNEYPPFWQNRAGSWELQRALAPLGNLIALDVHSTDYCGDFSNPEGVAETVKAFGLILLSTQPLTPQ